MRLIDADALPKEISWDKIENTAFWETINEQPTIDAVPVIRCKDCKWYEFDEKLHCGLPHGVRLKDDYCSDAERKEDAAD